ncbi:adoMet-dependent rRNA methyltransferase spb1-like [Forsythia ovata]|uniref:AdoMet-dependent rRNA methyltransferase spb1-like n=1 Tax=Forsythia ovata TaxID=205694 RepID=A0ABD1VK39_9LAMI
MDVDERVDEIQVDVPVEHLTVQEKTMKESPEQPIVGPKKTMSKLHTAKALEVDNDFEIVPTPVTDSSDSSSSDESDEDDIDSKAEILACAKKMLTKKQMEQIIDNAWCNKYMFHNEGLPKWSVEEEKRHYQPIKPVTK